MAKTVIFVYETIQYLFSKTDQPCIANQSKTEHTNFFFIITPRQVTFQTGLKSPFSGYYDKKVVIRFPVGRMAMRIRVLGSETLQEKK